MIVDDHQMVREGLKVLLSTCADIEVVGEAANGAEAVDAVPAHRAGRGPHGRPHAGHGRRRGDRRDHLGVPGGPVIALTSFVDQEYVEKALDAGAISYLLKDARPEALTQAIRDAVEGRGHHRQQRHAGAHGRAARTTSAGISPRREREVLALLAAGMSNKEIADDAHAQRGHRAPARQQHPLQARRAQPHDGRRHRHEARPDLTAEPRAPAITLVEVRVRPNARGAASLRRR